MATSNLPPTTMPLHQHTQTHEGESQPNEAPTSENNIQREKQSVDTDTKPPIKQPTAEDTAQTKKQGFPTSSAKVAEVRQWVVQWFDERDIAKAGQSGNTEWKCADLAWNGRDLYTLTPSALERGLKNNNIDEYPCELIIKSILDQRKRPSTWWDTFLDMQDVAQVIMFCVLAAHKEFIF